MSATTKEAEETEETYAISGRQMFHEVLLDIWNEIDGLEKTAENPFFTSKYVPLETLMGIVKPVCIKHKVLVQQGCNRGDDPNTMYVFTRLTHVPTGEFEEFEMPIPFDKRTAQAAGSMLTYGKRYTLQAALGLVADADDDGNVASQPQSRSQTSSGASTASGPQSAPPPEVEYESSQKSFPSGNTWSGKLTEVKMAKGVNKAGKAWERCDVTFAGETIGTFSESIRDRAMQAWGNKIPVKIQWSMSGKYKVLDRLDLETE